VCAKEPYATKEEAFIAAKGIGRNIGASMGHYKCESCDYWHINTKGKKAKAYRHHRDEKYPIYKKVMLMGKIVDLIVRC